MTKLLTAAEMRAIEGAAIESGRVTGLELMERAGRGVVGAVLDWWPRLAAAPHRAAVFCGPGNNGGDGFVIARLLRDRGWEVTLRLLGNPGKLPPDAASNAERWREAGEVRPFEDGEAGALVERADLVVDALFGTGLARPVEGTGRFFAATGAAVGSGEGAPLIVSVDLPSGLCADSGRPLVPPVGEAEGSVFAHGTVTFHRPKRGHCLGEGYRRSGLLRVVDIGLDGAPDDAARLVGREDIVAPPVLRQLAKQEGNHKYQHGHALVLAGGPGTGGAGRLAARGALRIGAGAVTLGVPPAAVPENAAQLDAIMLRPVEGLAEFLAGPGSKMNAVCLGPGMGRGGATREAVEAACRSGRPVVLDADALTSFEDDPDTLFALLHERCVLTPHLGEFGRIFPDLARRLRGPADRGPAFSKIDATREAAARSGAVVLLKGGATVIADPGGRVRVSTSARERSAPWLATAGAGDVLAGFIVGLLARGLAPRDAAATAAWLHVEAARRFGPGLIAEDLPEQIPAVFRDLGL